MRKIISIPIFLGLTLASQSCEPHFTSDFVAEISAKDDIINPRSEYIAVLGDVQAYTYYKRNYVLMQSIVWLQSQQSHYNNFKALLQVGDISETNNPSEWSIFKVDIDKLAPYMPVICCTGNHDYDWASGQIIESRESSLFNEYVSNPKLEENIVERFDENSLENIIVSIDIHGERYDVIALEFAPRKEAVAWADSIVASNPGQKYFLMTHEFIYNWDRVKSNSYAELQFKTLSASSPEYVWQNLVYHNDNIVCVLCGHNGFSEQVYSQNAAGREVPQILFNLQNQESGGDSMIELWEFPAEGDSAFVKVYHTRHHEVVTGKGTTFSFRYRY